MDVREMNSSKTTHTQCPRKPNALNCPHILPMSGDTVIGAPKINPDIGQVVYNPKNADDKFIRYPINL